MEKILTLNDSLYFRHEGSKSTSIRPVMYQLAVSCGYEEVLHPAASLLQPVSIIEM